MIVHQDFVEKKVKVFVFDPYNPTVRRSGEAIGSYEGVAGILLNTGEYIDAPESWIRVVQIG